MRTKRIIAAVMIVLGLGGAISHAAVSAVSVPGSCRAVACTPQVQ